MADTTNDVSIKLSAVDQVTPAVLKAVSVLEQMNTKLEELSKNSAKTHENTEGLHGGIVSLAAGLEIANVALEAGKLAWEAIEAPLEKAVEEALAAEKAQNLLTGALISTGNYSKETSESLNEYAEAVQKSSGANAESVKTHVALGIQMGLSVDKSKQMEEAARKLAVVMGGDQQAAFQALQQSLEGHSRGLAKVLPQIKEFGAAQLTQGAAIDVVNKALSAQYDQYQESLPAALDRAKSSYDELFKTIGQTITNSPALTAALSSLTHSLGELTAWIASNKSTMTDWVNGGISVALTALSALNNTIDILYRTGTAAFNGIAVVINSVFTLWGKEFEWLGGLLSHFPGVIGEAGKAVHDIAAGFAENTWAAAKQNVANVNDAINNQTTASKKLDTALLSAKDAANAAAEAHNNNAEANERAKQKASDNAKAQRDLASSYGGMTIGTFEQRKALDAQKQDQDKALSNFKKYYDSQIAIAVSGEAREAAEVANYKAKATKGIGGAAGLSLQQDAEVKAEKVKQQQLAAMKQQGLITDKEFNSLKESEQQESAGRMVDIAEQHYAAEAALQDKLGNSWEATMIRIENAQGKHGKAMATLQAVQASDEYKTMNTGLTNVSNLRNSHSKTAFELGKKAAIAQATVQTFMSATEAFASLASIPIVGPILGAAAAAAAIASGFVQIQNINAQQFSAAHGGIDSVPSDLDNSTFLLKGGERVVQPEANKDLTGFLANQTDTGQSKSTVMATVNLTVNGGTASKDDIKKTATMLAAELRRMSERGQQIINVKGVYT